MIVSQLGSTNESNLANGKPADLLCGRSTRQYEWFVNIGHFNTHTDEPSANNEASLRMLSYHL